MKPTRQVRLFLPWCRLILLLVVLPFTCWQTHADTLDDVKSRKIVLCGVNEGLPGFSISNAEGKWSGIDVDLCRALAAAVIGNGEAVTFIPLTARDRFPALRAGEVDVLIRNTTWTLSRDAELGVDFAGVNYYDGQGFMVRAASGFERVVDLDGARVCVTQDTTSALNLADHFRTHGMVFKPVAFLRLQEMFPAYDAGVCDVVTADQSSLVANRLQLSKPGEHVILQEVISKEPLGPAVREGDTRWSNVVRWTLYAMIAAEELDITTKNVDSMLATSTRVEVRRLLGVEGDLGKKLGLPSSWAHRILSEVGNYGESFHRHLGSGSPIKLPRGLNALWTQGGLMYAMPFR